MPNRHRGEARPRPSPEKPKRAARSVATTRHGHRSKNARRQHTKEVLRGKISDSYGKLSGEELLKLIGRVGYTPNSTV
ncbi:MAG TPA: hypothetical protein VJJ47_03495 [Candidatus Paceibacterota bacterium]